MQNLNLFNKNILLVTAHPDDEIYIAYSIIKKFGGNLKIITLTHGEKGKNHSQNHSEPLSSIRETEQKNTLSNLGFNLNNLVLLNFPDSELKNESGLKFYLTNIINEYNPDVVITLDPSGLTSHPDHITVAKTLFQISKESEFDLYFSVYPKLIRFFNFNMPTIKNMPFPTHYLKLSLVDRLDKYKSIFNHVSQFSTWRYRLFFLYFFFWSKETFHVADKNANYFFEIVDFVI